MGESNAYVGQLLKATHGHPHRVVESHVIVGEKSRHEMAIGLTLTLGTHRPDKFAVRDQFNTLDRMFALDGSLRKDGLNQAISTLLLHHRKSERTIASLEHQHRPGGHEAVALIESLLP